MVPGLEDEVGAERGLRDEQRALIEAPFGVKGARTAVAEERERRSA